MKLLASAVLASLLMLGAPAFAAFDPASMAGVCASGDCASQIASATAGMTEAEANEAMSSLAGELVAVAKANPNDPALLALIAAALEAAAAAASGDLAADIKAVADQVAAGDLDAIDDGAFGQVGGPGQGGPGPDGGDNGSP